MTLGDPLDDAVVGSERAAVGPEDRPWGCSCGHWFAERRHWQWHATRITVTTVAHSLVVVPVAPGGRSDGSAPALGSCPFPGTGVGPSPMHPTMQHRQPRGLATNRQEKPKAEWVDSGLPKAPVNHDRARMAAMDPDANAEVVGMFQIGDRQ